MIKYFLIILLAVSAHAAGFKLLSPKLLDLGEVPSDTIVSGLIKFNNDGDAEMKIEQIQTSCGCTLVELEKMIYQPGESGQVEVQFNTKGFSGVTRKNITIYIEGEKYNRQRIILEADVRPLLEYSPLFIDFQDVKLDNPTAADSMVIKNNMKKTMSVAHIKPDNKNIEVSPDSFTLEPGEKKKVSITYRARRAGRDDGVIAIQISHPKKIEKRIPVFIEVAP